MNAGHTHSMKGLVGCYCVFAGVCGHIYSNFSKSECKKSIKSELGSNKIFMKTQVHIYMSFQEKKQEYIEL